VVERGLRYYSGNAELITTKEQGKQLAADLGDGTAIVMRNHGVTLAANSGEECLLLALNLEKALQAQLLAEMCGGARHRIEPAMAVQMGQKLLSSRKRTEDLFAYNVRKAERILASIERRS
jgi:ribulose-5-phosphate 4-epimerase/fuculose-1-phosphate aldolase